MRLNRNLAPVVAGALVLVFLGGIGGAVAATQIGSAGIRDNSIRSIDIKDGSGLRLRDLTPYARAKLTKDTDTDVLGGLVAQVTEQENIAQIGGSFKTGATVFTKTLDLPSAGTYQVNAYGFFDTVAADSPRTDATHLMLAIRDAGAGEFGNDYGTCFTGAFPQGDREATCQSVRTIHVDAPTSLYVKAFGYNDDTSGTGSGSFTVAADVSADRVG